MVPAQHCVVNRLQVEIKVGGWFLLTLWPKREKWHKNNANKFFSLVPHECDWTYVKLDGEDARWNYKYVSKQNCTCYPLKRIFNSYACQYTDLILLYVSLKFSKKTLKTIQYFKADTYI